MNIKELSNDELLEAFKKAKDHHEKVWHGCQDGSYECAYYYNVQPYEDECRARGLI